MGNSQSSSPLSSPISSPTPSYPKFRSAVTTEQSASSLHSVRAPSSLSQRPTFSARASSALRSSHSSDADAEGDADADYLDVEPAPVASSSRHSSRKVRGTEARTVRSHFSPHDSIKVVQDEDSVSCASVPHYRFRSSLPFSLPVLGLRGHSRRGRR